MKFEFSRQIFKKISNTKFHKNPSIESRVVTCGQTDRRMDGRTDMTQLIVAFRRVTNAPETSTFCPQHVEFYAFCKNLRKNRDY